MSNVASRTAYIGRSTWRCYSRDAAGSCLAFHLPGGPVSDSPCRHRLYAPAPCNPRILWLGPEMGCPFQYIMGFFACFAWCVVLHNGCWACASPGQGEAATTWRPAGRSRSFTSHMASTVAVALQEQAEAARGADTVQAYAPAAASNQGHGGCAGYMSSTQAF